MVGIGSLQHLQHCASLACSFQDLPFGCPRSKASCPFSLLHCFPASPVPGFLACAELIHAGNSPLFTAHMCTSLIMYRPAQQLALCSPFVTAVLHLSDVPNKVSDIPNKVPVSCFAFISSICPCWPSGRSFPFWSSTQLVCDSCILIPAQYSQLPCCPLQLMLLPCFEMLRWISCRVNTELC